MAITLSDMRSFLSRAYSSVNQNKINGIHAEVDFFNYLNGLGFAGRTSPGGWIMRPSRVPNFGAEAIAVFPEIVQVGGDYSPGRQPPQVPPSVEAAAYKLRDAHIKTYFCYPVEYPDGRIAWMGMRRGIPDPPPPSDIVDQMASMFIPRRGKYNFLKYHANVSGISDEAIQDQYSLAALRIYANNAYMMETSDVDRLLWGANTIYPVEVKEKTRVTNDVNIGEWFGLDVGPFTKLAFFAAWYGQLKSLFIVREIADTETRQLVQWWAIEFADVAKHASWVFQSGGANMLGGRSAVVRIPLHAFTPLDGAFLNAL
jgi:hypothetical protein